ncbi:hypothetical protein [Actinoplanes couchii]|uniref:Uncharacterized protein n=1 Tax=Actinoplanes couchii TaxID=403638 RepID=A0ABQ3X177_9ACTN|nr:hypothetical protein [Actinoplanes couchii]MDR6316541.1 hypothetical protein [Actinoplanes couchii]GID52155.1 hypothetical protein Aco03nite_005590 [Actinoplanes couchii]
MSTQRSAIRPNGTVTVDAPTGAQPTAGNQWRGPIAADIPDTPPTMGDLPAGLSGGQLSGLSGDLPTGLSGGLPAGPPDGLPAELPGCLLAELPGCLLAELPDGLPAELPGGAW